MDTAKILQLRNIAVSLAVGLATVVLSTLIVSTVVGISLVDLRQRPNLLSIVMTSGIIGGFLAFSDRALTGLFNGVCLATFGAIFVNGSTTPHYYASYVFGIILGSLLAAYPVRVTLLTLFSVIILVIIGHVDDVLVFIPALAFSTLLLFLTQKTFTKVYSPAHAYLSRSVVTSLAAFITMYILIILFFALTYSCVNYSLPSVAFKSSSVQPSEMSFGFFIYFSTITIGTVGYGDVVPGHWTTRALTSAETITGTIWIVVYFAFLMRKLSEGT